MPSKKRQLVRKEACLALAVGCQHGLHGTTTKLFISTTSSTQPVETGCRITPILSKTTYSNKSGENNEAW
jgi:hypothetical protein